MNESAIVLYKNELIAASVGTPNQVDFSFDKIWDFKKKHSTIFNPAYLKFYHTHTDISFLAYSLTDENCLKGLNIAFNFPVYFSIIVQNINHPFTHAQISYQYYKRMVEVEDKPLTNEYLNLLSFLSRGIL